mmetsp:Transcript_6174/g.17588  ORF Transcript_6174/g.17588 Transcript_6174/m.17588 type:complete len:216 (-) Transcript_6174:21-668(-)
MRSEHMALTGRSSSGATTSTSMRCIATSAGCAAAPGGPMAARCRPSPTSARSVSGLLARRAPTSMLMSPGAPSPPGRAPRSCGRNIRSSRNVNRAQPAASAERGPPAFLLAEALKAVHHCSASRTSWRLSNACEFDCPLPFPFPGGAASSSASSSSSSVSLGKYTFSRLMRTLVSCGGADGRLVEAAAIAPSRKRPMPRQVPTKRPSPKGGMGLK